MGNCTGSANADVSYTEFPKLGIKFSYVCNEFMEECGGKAVLAGLTTEDVCKKFIKPSTKEKLTSYCEKMICSEKNKRFVGTPTAFISHAWKSEFLYLVSALQDRFKDEPEAYIWIDIFSFNQHKTLYLDQSWCINLLLPAIKGIGCTIMVMNILEPVAYTRSWCVLEAYCTHLSEGEFEIVMTDEIMQQFLRSAELDPKETFNTLRSAIDSTKSTVSRSDDKAFLHELFKIETGMPEMDILLFKQLRSFIIVLVKNEIDDNPDDIKRQEGLWDMLNVFYSYMGNGKYEPSKEMLEDNLNERHASLGDNHPETQRAMHNLGLYHLEEGRYQVAKEILSQCLRMRKATVGMTDRETVKLIGDLATIYEKLDDCRNAERLYRQLLGQQRSSLGASHADTLSSILSLESLSKSQTVKTKDPNGEVPTLRSSMIQLNQTELKNRRSVK
jgi:hypothetical protein